MTNHEFRAIRKRLGLTQAELARVVGYYGAMHISQFERAKNPRAVPHLLALLMEAYAAGYRPTSWPPSARKSTQ